MTTQERNNTAAGMVRDALERLLALESVQNLRHFENTKDEAAHWLDLAQDALDYFAQHYDFDAESEARPFARLSGAWAVVRHDNENGMEICGVYPDREAATAGLCFEFHRFQESYAKILVEDGNADSIEDARRDVRALSYNEGDNCKWYHHGDGEFSVMFQAVPFDCADGVVCDYGKFFSKEGTQCA